MSKKYTRSQWENGISASKVIVDAMKSAIENDTPLFVVIGEGESEIKAMVNHPLLENYIRFYENEIHTAEAVLKSFEDEQSKT